MGRARQVAIAALPGQSGPPPRNAAAQAAVDFINGLTHTRGEWAGQPFRLRPWQEALVRYLFGTLRPDGYRQYRTCYVEIPRKNGKTELAAAIALYMLLADGERGAQVYSAATDLEQAALAFNAAEQMVRNDAELSAMVEIVPSRKRIVYHRHGSFYRAIPADAPSSHGYDASAIIYDELHAAPNRELFTVLRTAVGSRRQPLLFMITTAGHDRNSICWQQHTYAERVRDGEVTDPTFLPVLYGAPPDADWLDENVWRAANPALGDFRSLDEMRMMAREAREVPASQNDFRRLYLCQWTESATRWLDPAVWDAGALPLRPLEGRPCYAGLDLSTTTDLTALVLVFPADDGTVDVLPLFFCPAEGIAARARMDHAPYAEWQRAGLLEATDRHSVDYDLIRQRIRALCERFRVQRITYDRYNSSQLVGQLLEDGAPMVALGQGYASMNAPARELERRVIDRTIRHAGHPVLRWCLVNTVVETDAAGNLKPSKRKSTERIDGTVALIMALDGLIRAEGGSPYDERVRRGESALLMV